MTINMNDFMAQLEDCLEDSDINFSDLSTQVSLKITDARLKLGMNQKQFAEHLGVSQSMISRWESETYNFTLKTICEILDKLDIKVSLLFAPKNSNYSERKLESSVPMQFDSVEYHNFICESFNKYDNRSTASNWSFAN